MKKNNRTSIIVLIIGIILVISVGIALFMGLSNSDDTKKNNGKNDGDNVVTEDGNNYTVKLEGTYLLVTDVVDFKDDDKLSYANVTVEGVEVDGKKVDIEITNIPSNSSCKDAEEAVNKEVKIDDVTVLIVPNELCDTIDVKEIFVYEEKYIGIVYTKEDKFTLAIYNTSGEALYQRTVLTVDAKAAKFTGFEEFDEDYIINYYELRITDDEITDYMYERGKDSYCNKDTNEGKC